MKATLCISSILNLQDVVCIRLVIKNCKSTLHFQLLMEQVPSSLIIGVSSLIGILDINI